MTGPLTANELRAKIRILSDKIERYRDIDSYSDMLRAERYRLRDELDRIEPPTHCRHGVRYDAKCPECDGA